MRVNKYKIRVSNSGSTVNIPISLNIQPLGQAEIVEREFVNKEIDKAINPIVDYEKVRFSPVDSNDNSIKKIIYNVNLLNGGSFPTTTMYSDAGFVYDDIRFGKNNFKKSFLRLSFYDSDVPTNQNLISFITLFSRITINDINLITSGGNGLPKNTTEIPVRFSVEDPIENPEGIAEGYHIYHFKDEVTNVLPKNLYVRSSWNNAKTGESLPLITDNSPQIIDDLVSKLHMKYILKRDNTGWFYEIDMTYAPNNVVLNGDTQTIDLYQIQVV